MRIIFAAVQRQSSGFLPRFRLPSKSNMAEPTLPHEQLVRKPLGVAIPAPPQGASTGVNPKATRAARCRPAWISCGSFRQQARTGRVLWWEGYWSQR